MATALRDVPAAVPEQPPSLGIRTGAELARQVAEQHRKNLAARRHASLYWEKYLIHIDGRGNNQYADILYNTRVAIPRDLQPYQVQHNLLRPITDNMVAWHTTMPFRFAV